MQGCVQQGIEVPQEMIQPRDYGIQEQHLNSQKTGDKHVNRTQKGGICPGSWGPGRKGWEKRWGDISLSLFSSSALCFGS